MSGTTGVSSYGTLAQVLASASSLRAQYTKMQEQTTSGLISQSYSGIAANSSQVLDISAALTQNTAYTAAIAQAQGKATAMQNVLSQISTLVTNMSSIALTAESDTAGTSVTAMAQQANLALSQMASLLNTTYGGEYLFSGADSSNAPVPDADSVTSSGLFTQIGAQVSALATVPTTPAIDTVIANTVSIAANTAADTTIFSSYLTGAGATAGSTDPVKIQIGPSQSVVLDLPANQNVGAASDPNGTGNAISDIVRSLAVMANSTDAMTSNPDFVTLMKNVVTTLSSAGATLTQESAQIGVTQNVMTAASTSQATTATLLKTQLTGLTNVDLPTAVANLQAVNTQLQASYQVLADFSKMSLASYL